jgi:hypothetical protein
MHRPLATVLAAALALAGAASAVEVFKWKDARGVVHYGDHPASGAAKAVSVPGDTRSPEDAASAGERLERAREKLAEPPAVDAAAPVARATPPRTPASYNCAEAWHRYDAAQACYSSHRAGAGKGVSPAGLAACRPMPQPSCER